MTDKLFPIRNWQQQRRVETPSFKPRSRRAASPSAKQPLQAWPDAQETTIGSLENRGRRRPAGQKAERTQKRDGPPHGSKRLSARKQLPAFFGMKPRKQLGAIDGAGTAWIAGIDKVNCPASIETAHQRNLPQAERTTAIEPDGDLRRHGTTLSKDVVPSIWASTCIPAMRPDAAGRKRPPNQPCPQPILDRADFLDTGERNLASPRAQYGAFRVLHFCLIERE